MLRGQTRRNLVFKILLSFIMFSDMPAIAQGPLINALNSKLIEVETIQPNDTFAGFDEFSKALTNNKIIALGEATHGTKEFVDFKRTLIKQLVTKLNYKVIVLEGDFSGAQALNDYILYGNGNKNECFYKMGIWIWNNQEFLNMVNWLKAYNLTQSFSNKVKIYGCDMQVPEISRYIIDGSVKLKKQLSAEAEKGLQFVKNGRGKTEKVELKALQKLALELKEEILLYPDTSLIRHSIKTIIQHIDLRAVDNWYNETKIRDRFMAENIEWIYDHELKTNMIFMAHNTHISKNPIYNDIKRTGWYLKEKYKDGYYALGFSFFSGGFFAVDEKTGEFTVFTLPEIKNKESSEFILSQCRTPNFILDFKKGMEDVDVHAFLNKKIYSKDIGASYSIKKIKSEKDVTPDFMPLYDKFDGLVFFKTTSAISSLFPEGTKNK